MGPRTGLLAVASAAWCGIACSQAPSEQDYASLIANGTWESYGGDFTVDDSATTPMPYYYYYLDTPPSMDNDGSSGGNDGSDDPFSVEDGESEADVTLHMQVMDPVSSILSVVAHSTKPISLFRFNVQAVLVKEGQDLVESTQEIETTVTAVYNLDYGFVGSQTMNGVVAFTMTGEEYPPSEIPFVLCDLKLEVTSLSENMDQILNGSADVDLRFCFNEITMTNSDGDILDVEVLGCPLDDFAPGMTWYYDQDDAAVSWLVHEFPPPLLEEDEKVSCIPGEWSEWSSCECAADDQPQRWRSRSPTNVEDLSPFAWNSCEDETGSLFERQFCQDAAAGFDGAHTGDHANQGHVNGEEQCYSVSTAPYNRFISDASAKWTTVTLVDDMVTRALDLGFQFDFFGDRYSSIRVSSNGWATFMEGDDWSWCTTNYTLPGFGTNAPFVPSMNDDIVGPWLIDQGWRCAAGGYLDEDLPIPRRTGPNNLIAFAWEDLDPAGELESKLPGVPVPKAEVIVAYVLLWHGPSWVAANMRATTS